MLKNLMIACLTLTIGAAAASAKIKGCYERQFDKAHLEANPYQAVSFMQLQYGLAEGGGEEDLDTLMVRRDDAPGKFYAAFQCTASGKSLTCETEESTTGGRTGKFKLTETTAGVRLDNPGRLDLLIEGSHDLITIIDAELQNTTFSLKKVSGGNCR